MKKFLILATSSIILAFALPAFASADDAYCGGTTGQWMSMEEAITIAVANGYEVRRIKTEDGCFEIYAIDKYGARFELYMNPVSGEIVAIKNKS